MHAPIRYALLLRKVPNLLIDRLFNQVGTAEQKLAANKTQLGILEEQKKSDEEQVRIAKETNTQMMNVREITFSARSVIEHRRQSLRTAEGDFHTAIEKLPSGSVSTSF